MVLLPGGVSIAGNGMPLCGSIRVTLASPIDSSGSTAGAGSAAGASQHQGACENSGGDQESGCPVTQLR